MVQLKHSLIGGTLAAFTLAAATMAAASGSGPKPASPDTKQPVTTPTRQFTLFVHEPKAKADERTDPKKGQAYWSAFAAYGKQLADAGVMLGGSAVEPPATGSTVRVREGKTRSETPMLADGQEFVGGYFVIAAKDLNAAIEWAAKCPAALDGTIEVRVNVPMVAGK